MQREPPSEQQSETEQPLPQPLLSMIVFTAVGHEWAMYIACERFAEDNQKVIQCASSFDNIADSKKGYMYIDDFEEILNEFLTAFEHVKPLCEKVRGVLFHLLKDGALFTGTPSEDINNSQFFLLGTLKDSLLARLCLASLPPS
ncbi:MAG: hypothetical protein Q9203_006567 [Teloschistes exilis]